MDQVSRDHQIPENDPKTLDGSSIFMTGSSGDALISPVTLKQKAMPDDKLPDGLLWDVPTTSGFSLDRSSEVMAKIGTRYVWWDWMCVPRETLNGHRTITDSLRSAGHEETGEAIVCSLIPSVSEL
ncbi:uncharacterized protein EAF02_005468 [Botrytis sinoallii]|uniref:uncharacterized protein n=1 Tax=Botrytis sinoallii TaxID=1463999 RepID=UPI001900A53C|nr:uncharacterized protein EAF02_005468 [Botrytis sinoallii]KAF7883548.1 hypothetical protein EAF02_005468 [Botrytis sinoallii]